MRLLLLLPAAAAGVSVSDWLLCRRRFVSLSDPLPPSLTISSSSAFLVRCDTHGHLNDNEYNHI